MNQRNLHKARQWWGFVYKKKRELMYKYYDSEHIIDCGYERDEDVYNIWEAEGKPIVQLKKS